jgi:hypothetical protein
MGHTLLHACVRHCTRTRSHDDIRIQPNDTKPTATRTEQYVALNKACLPSQPTQSTFDNTRFCSAHVRVRSWTRNKNYDWGIAQSCSCFVLSLHSVFTIVNKDRAIISMGRNSEVSSTGYKTYKTRFHIKKSTTNTSQDTPQPNLGV